jgi:hypothetical protein
VRAEAAHSLPRLDLGGAQIGDVMIAVDGNSFLLQPFRVRVDVRLIRIVTRARLLRLNRTRGMRVMVIVMTVTVTVMMIVMMRRFMTGFRAGSEMERG